MAQNGLSPLGGFSPLLSLQGNRQQRQAHVPSPIIVPGYPVDAYAARVKAAEARARPPAAAVRSPPLPVVPPSPRVQRPATAGFAAPRQAGPAQPPPWSAVTAVPGMAAAQAQVTQPQTASFTQFAFNVPQFQPMAVPATAQAGAAYFGAAQAQQTAAPARPQSAPPTQARLVPVDPSRMDADDVVWLDGRPYDKRAFADSLTPQMRAELARKTDDAFPTRKVPWIKWHVLCTYGFDPDDYPEAALAIERGVRHRVGEEVLPPLKDDSPSFQALILGETKERCRKMYKRWGKGKRSYTCEDVDDYVRPRHPCGHEILPDCPVHGHNAMHSPVSPHCHKHGHGAMHSAGWPGTPVSAHGVGTYQGFPAAQDGFSPRTAPLSTGYAFTAQQTMPATFTWPGLVPGSVPGLHSGHGWTFA